jgi:hypothetical protein
MAGENAGCGDCGCLEGIYTLQLAFCAIRGAGTKNLLYAAILHLLAGAVAGSVFKIRTLLLLLSFVLIEAVVLILADIRMAGLWALVNLSTVQVGYIAGVLARGVLEQAGFSLPPVRIRRP